MATGRQCLRAKAHNLPHGHNHKQHKCYDIFVFFGFKGKHSHSPSQQVSQNIFAIRVARVILSKKQVYFSPTPPHFPQKHPFLFFQLATHRPRPHSPPISSLEGAPTPHTHVRVHAHITEFRTFCLHPSPPPYKTLYTNNLHPKKRVNIRPKKPSHHLHQTTSRVSAHDRG